MEATETRAPVHTDPFLLCNAGQKVISLEEKRLCLEKCADSEAPVSVLTAVSCVIVLLKAGAKIKRPRSNKYPACPSVWISLVFLSPSSFIVSRSSSIVVQPSTVRSHIQRAIEQNFQSGFYPQTDIAVPKLSLTISNSSFISFYIHSRSPFSYLFYYFFCDAAELHILYR
ncbi:hypothetical protein DTO280E4_1286 [Paecilomyces variotii]|nr:hypothetical protein DTO280E4_1286 [Paecilomyces variotii]KAJ9396065.1 hypothetical protein DTO282F9_7040 [Paecilomyces variotii]